MKKLSLLGLALAFLFSVFPFTHSHVFAVETNIPQDEKKKLVKPKYHLSTTAPEETKPPKDPKPVDPKPDKPVPDHPKPDKLKPDKSVTDKPKPDKPNTDKPVTDKPKPNKPKPHKPATDKPITDKPKPDKPNPQKPVDPKDEVGGNLPKTASPYPNGLLIGFLFIAIGCVAIFRFRQA